MRLAFFAADDAGATIAGLGKRHAAIASLRLVLDALLAGGIAAPEHIRELLLLSVEVVPGARTALQQLKDEGYRLGVVSSAGYPPFVEMALEMLGLRTFFSEVLTSAGEGIYKSDPEIFLRAVSRLGGSPRRAVHVGDHAVYDVQTAKKAGLFTIWFTRNAMHTAHLHGSSWDEAMATGAEANVVVERLEEVPGAIERITV